MISNANLQPSATSEAEAETQLLLSTDESGRIPFPEGNSREVAFFLRALSRLDERGHIQHRLQNGYLACFLSESGRQLKSQTIASREEGRRAPQASGFSHSARTTFVLALTALLWSAAA